MSKRNILIVSSMIIYLIGYTMYAKVYKIDKNKLFDSYQVYLEEQNIKAQSHFGKLTQNKKVNLQDLYIKSCYRKDSVFSCHVQSQIENFRGVEVEHLELTVDTSKNYYKIVKVLTEVKK